MKHFKTFLKAAGAFFLVLIVLSLRPVNIVSEDKCKEVSGVVTHIFEGGPYDVVFLLMDNNTTFYINRGLEKGLSLEKLQKDLIGNQINIKYPPHWTPLDPTNSNEHISKVEWNGEFIFSEL